MRQRCIASVLVRYLPEAGSGKTLSRLRAEDQEREKGLNFVYYAYGDLIPVGSTRGVAVVI
jgi:hypothetical protein